MFILIKSWNDNILVELSVIKINFNYKNKIKFPCLFLPF